VAILSLCPSVRLSVTVVIDRHTKLNIFSYFVAHWLYNYIFLNQILTRSSSLKVLDMLNILE